MWHYDREAERQINIAGPVRHSWGPKRPRYPPRAQKLNSAGMLLARGCEAVGIDWTETPLAPLSAPQRAPPGLPPSCVYRGLCRFGCSTNAKRSALTVWIPRALSAGADIRDLAMVGRIETGTNGRATGVHYHREGEWRFQRARNVVVAGYAVESPRLLLNSANDRYPDGLANSSGLVGKNLMTQSNQAVWERMEQQVRWNKGPPSLAIIEHWNDDDKKDFFGGYGWLGHGPLPVEWATVQTGSRGLWGQAMHDHAPHGGTHRRACEKRRARRLTMQASLCVATVALLCGLSTITSGFADTGTSQTAQDLVQAAVATIKQIKSDKQYATELGDAKAVFIIPEPKGSFTAGGTGARGVFLKHTNYGLWNGPVFMTVNSISIGGQAGRQAGPAAMLLMTSKAVRIFTKANEVTLDSSAGLTVVGYVANSGSALGNGDIELWSSPNGAFEGASIEGAHLTRDTGLGRSYYGRQVSITDILSGRVSSANADALRKALPL